MHSLQSAFSVVVCAALARDIHTPDRTEGSVTLEDKHGRSEEKTVFWF